MFECPFYIYLLEQCKKIFKPAKRYRIVEKEDELGYFLEEIKEQTGE